MRIEKSETTPVFMPKTGVFLFICEFYCLTPDNAFASSGVAATVVKISGTI